MSFPSAEVFAVKTIRAGKYDYSYLSLNNKAHRHIREGVQLACS